MIVHHMQSVAKQRKREKVWKTFENRGNVGNRDKTWKMEKLGKQGLHGNMEITENGEIL
jgi:hypothetical protein